MFSGHMDSMTLARAVRSFYEYCRNCVPLSYKRFETHRIALGLRRGCMLSRLLFVTYMAAAQQRQWKLQKWDLQAGYLAIAMISYYYDLPSLNSRGCSTPSTCTAMIIASTDRDRCENGLRQVYEKKYLGVWFASDGGRTRKLRRALGRAGLSEEAKLSIDCTMYMPAVLYMPCSSMVMSFFRSS